MTEIVTLLFDEYTKNLSASQGKTDSRDAKTNYHRLRDLVGDDIALDIWDSAVAEGAEMQEAFFQAGLKTGLVLAQELFSL